MEVRVFNSSSAENIYVLFKTPEDANTPEAPTDPIGPGSTVSKPVSAATMNLFVWTDYSEEPIWSGAVPTKVQKVIMVFPEKREVSYDGVILPSGFSPVTDPRRLEVGKMPEYNKYMYLMWLIIILLVVALVYFFWWKK